MKTEEASSLNGRRILIAATGSIAAVKTPLLVSGLIKSGNSFTKSFVDEGVFLYFCPLHPWMDGIVVVGNVEYILKCC